ncbi:MAG: hypothetical protein ABIG84_05220 [archaeon]
MRKWFSNLTPDAQAKIFLGITVAQILVNVFVVIGVVVVVFKLLVV